MNGPEITIYETKNCPNCKALKAMIKAAMPHVYPKTVDMSTPSSLTELRINGIFTLSAPVLQIGDVFYTTEDLFEGNVIKTEAFQKVIAQNLEG